MNQICTETVNWKILSKLISEEILIDTLRFFDFLYPAGIYLLKVDNRNTRARCEICSKLTVKTPEQCHWRIFHILF